MWKIGLVGILLAMLIGSFFVTLRLIDTGPLSVTAHDDRSDAERLASRSIFDRADLIEAAVGAGLHSSAEMRGVMEEISRIDDGHVIIRGWLADPASEGASLTVVVFVAGKKAATTQTLGERPDVTNALKLAFGAEKNVGFQVSFNCPTGDHVIIVGLGTDKQYFYLTSTRCP
jgi:hypothetical protein